MYFKYFPVAAINSNDASALLNNGISSYSLNPFGTIPLRTDLAYVNSTSSASFIRFDINSIPSNAINESLPQSRNHGYPAITVDSPVDSLFTMKLSDAIMYFLTKFLYACCFDSSDNFVFSNFEFSIK